MIGDPNKTRTQKKIPDIFPLLGNESGLILECNTLVICLFIAGHSALVQYRDILEFFVTLK